MGTTTFSGPIKAGTIKDTTGTTVGENIQNTGFVLSGATFKNPLQITLFDADVEAIYSVICSLSLFSFKLKFNISVDSALYLDSILDAYILADSTSTLNFCI